MAIIETFNGSIESGFEGRIETLTISADILIERIARKSDNAPDFRVYHLTETFRSDIGAGWIEESEDRATKYVSLGNISKSSKLSKMNLMIKKKQLE